MKVSDVYTGGSRETEWRARLKCDARGWQRVYDAIIYSAQTHCFIRRARYRYI